jgi:hypothetical protein
VDGGWSCGGRRLSACVLAMWLRVPGPSRL